MTWEEAVLWLRNQPDQCELVRACFYDDPVAAAAERYYQSSEWISVRSLLPSRRGRALDLGAGRGISAYALARDGWQTTAAEPDPSAVVGAAAIRSLARACGLSIEVVEHTGEALPFPDSAFELVHCRAVMHHARDLRQLCREVARVLVPEGLFLATREHVITRAADLPAFLDSHPLHRLYQGEHAYLQEEYIAALRSAGLRVVAALNPWESDINLFPQTRQSLKRQLAKRMRMTAFARLIPDGVLRALGRRLQAPGRLYTFLAQKPNG